MDQAEGLSFEIRIDLGKLGSLETTLSDLVEDAHTKIGDVEWFQKADRLFTDIKKAKELVIGGRRLPADDFSSLLERVENLLSAFPAKHLGY